MAVENGHFETSATKPNVGKTDGFHGLTSTWPAASDLAGYETPCRLEGEIGSLVVYGTVPPAINGTFYRVMSDPYTKPHPGFVPLDGDGSISAFRFTNGNVDTRIRYVETERYKLERQAAKNLFGLYRNPFTHHPCVRAAVDSTANTNVVFWANRLLALKEGALPYAVDPHTLETLSYNPFVSQGIRSKTFTAHPKHDPFTNELVVFGYEATGLASLDIITYTLDSAGTKTSESWLKAPWCGMIHDMGITRNWLVLNMWPFEASLERMKSGGLHWAWDYERPATFILVPRRGNDTSRYGWAPRETSRWYTWKNCMALHVGGAWDNDDGTINFETTRIHDNAFPFFPPENGRAPEPDAKADFVRWRIDPSEKQGVVVDDPEVLLDAPCEFPRVDERFYTERTEWVFCNAFMPGRDGGSNIFLGLNAVVRLNTRTGSTEYFDVGPGSFVQEPVFIPKGEDAKEGDGWVMALVERRVVKRCDVIIIDTEDFSRPVAVVEMPLHLKAQTHGNWVDGARLGQMKRLVREYTGKIEISGQGALEPMF